MKDGRRCTQSIRYVPVAPISRSWLTRLCQLALVAWKQNFFKHLQNSSNGTSRLTQALLRQIEQQRNGEAGDSGLLKRVIESYGKHTLRMMVRTTTEQWRQSLSVWTRQMCNGRT